MYIYIYIYIYKYIYIYIYIYSCMRIYMNKLHQDKKHVQMYSMTLNQ